jgi:iron complex outermembrane receptor protein
VLSALLIGLCAVPALAQDRVVQGTVTDGATGEPLPGANVAVQGTQVGTTTGVDGTYQIEVPDSDAVLVFSFVGYREQNVRVRNRETINVTLQEQVGQLEEVVVTGYGAQQRGEISGAISSVDVPAANVGQVSSPQDLLQGRVAGVSIVSNSGAPGSGQRVRIRGRKSLSASADPLYVIDGVSIGNTNVTPSGANGATNSANPLSFINPRDIESIQVLKGPAATAIYGSQGSNGVLVIETKGGTAGRLQVDYSGQMSAGAPARELNLLTPDEFRAAREEFADADLPETGVNTDWQDEVMRSTLSHEHNLSFSGGTEQTSYRGSASYFDQEGLLQSTGLERITGRINASHTALDDRLRLNLRLFRSYLERNHSFRQETGGGTGGSVIKDMLTFPPNRPVQQNGAFFEYAEQNRNPVAMLEQISDVSNQNRTIGNLDLQFDVLDDLTVEGTFSADLSEGQRRTYVPIASAVGRDVGGIGRQAQREFQSFVTQSLLTYDRDALSLFGLEHSVRLLGGFEFERETFQTIGVETQDFVTDAVPGFNNLGGGSNVQTPSSGKEQVDQVSFFGQFNYNYQDKYLVTASLRRDGSSVFGERDKFALFPSASLGWNVAQEPFLDVQGLSQLKVRVSGGVSGNQGVPPLQTLPVLTASRGNAGVFGADNEVIGVAQTRTASPGLKWEETTEFNVGVDFTAGRFSGTVDYYRSQTEDLLLNVRVVQPAPSNFVLDNVGSVSNTGVEASLEALVVDRQDLNLTVTANASSNRNEIDDLGGRGTIDHGTVGGRGQSGVTSQRLEPGHPIGSFYGPVFVRVNDNGEEVYRTADGGTTTDPGVAADTHLGNPIPDVAYSLNLDFRYRNFDLSAFFRGEQGRELFNNTGLVYTSKSRLAQGINMLEPALNDGTTTNHTGAYSSRWVQDASFLRLDKLSLGYDVGNALGNTLYNVRQARIFASANNLFVITPYSGYDPELNTNTSGEGLGFRSLATPARGIDWTSYPRPRTFTLGIELGF